MTNPIAMTLEELSSRGHLCITDVRGHQHNIDPKGLFTIPDGDLVGYKTKYGRTFFIATAHIVEFIFTELPA